MPKIPQATLQQQFKTTNYIGLAMMAAVFIYAALVLAVDHGWLPLKAAPAVNAGLAANLRYILLGVALLQYFLIRYFQKFSRKSPNYLPPGAIIIFALCEAVAVYGLVLFFISGNRTDFFIFMLISLLYFYLFYPKYAEWEKLWIQSLSTKKSAQ